MNTNYFEGVKNLSELKKQYHKMAMENHPDKHQNDKEKYENIMKDINNQYSDLFIKFKSEHNKKEENKEKQTQETPDCLINIISKLMQYNLEIEIVGLWVWLEKDNTFEIKDTVLHPLGFQWSKSRKKWYYGETFQTGFKYYKKKSFNTLRNTYGSIKVKGNKPDDDKSKRKKVTFINVSKNAYNPV
ncbi:MAG: J domain-containing protein [Syntrophothermus sp.]